jgi:hypothetical protein
MLRVLVFLTVVFFLEVQLVRLWLQLFKTLGVDFGEDDTSAAADLG